ncbi:BREX-1 system adenine-specific DNA-methyltransferase PglX [Xanthomonas campestris pv. raphani]|uniref:BREX-1 system adenine-specific DNA-methyltransferase PglX n=1 Tax=Xanthomonas campestris TaxID=339 RepID=UPI001E4CB44B|nr:BREX-1 system adenine-specific DNA-methyltransferase PglX [Xanthomonas campestris]MCC8486666.1 BREX-1 system adenine-specific DNA-methyltransferase PglX [Xanthomonas campestris]MEA9650673.1 BREX-1 system adenine-specific DNA-methyltransferase PglX [Xanthomonas campestris pv. raphani]MEA9735282.1 BREX-1 system adenine-specific DNA-methyltransferase PglX [Xanthomonas campestris pv. raphani]MEA9743959.1 BREX-1 system adenine-specific DNA-methyltransferase PglX [Xanthomonas campestris pv. raphan
MNTGNLKSYAPQARKDFIAAVTARANLLGLSEAKGALQMAEAEVKNDIVMIAGRPWPVKANEQRNKLIVRMKLQGFGHTVEAVAYAWFNRLVALRYMEVHDYLGHGRRVLSNRQGGLPEVLAQALDLAESNALPGLSTDTVRELMLANQDSELYRLILIAQCNALNQAMPFLFEQLGDETELLLPGNLLLTDSVVAKLVQSIPEEDWQQIEIIGWLYQFYISEKKDQVIGKVVKSEDIPAATQLFTPNWIVKYMVQNSLGAQWLATYPDSPLKAQMAYYIEPALQTDDVNAQLAAITPSSLNPEELTLIDPASGSGHILVEAYDLFKAIYLERGYRQRDVAKLILEKNLFGLDIDERAAQLTGFALMMKGRADDRQLFERGLKLNVMALVDSAGFDAERLAEGVKLADYELGVGDLAELKNLFEHATTFGSLIQVPEGGAGKLPALKRLSGVVSQDLFVSEALNCLRPLVQQAEFLAARYDAVVMNPPYMGRKGMNPLAKEFLATSYRAAQNDMYAAFMTRSRSLLRDFGLAASLTRQDWMFTARNQPFREDLLDTCALRSLLHVGPNTFPELSGDIVQGASAVFWGRPVPGIATTFMDATAPDTDQKLKSFESISSRFIKMQEVFARLPGRPLAYWAPAGTIDAFDHASIESVSISDGQNKTADNEKFVRQLWEVDCNTVGQGVKWLPYAKGGGFRKWAGNITDAVNWSPEARAHYRKSSRCRIVPEYLWYRPGVTWSRVASAGAPNGFRILPSGSTFDMVGSSIFLRDNSDIGTVLGILNTGAAAFLLQMLNPSVDLQVSDVRNLPFILPPDKESFDDRVSRLVSLAQADWDAYELSWNFQFLPLLTASSEPTPTLESSYTAWITKNRNTIAEMKRLEEENNRLFIDAYGLQGELTSDVPIEQITLTVNPSYRYGDKFTDDERWIRFRQATISELVSYVIGCMMGRYSLDLAGLIYANSGNIGFDASRYTKFPADIDGIVPVTEELWFEDDAALRVREFLLAVWGPDSLEQNMAFLADNLGRKASESPEQAIRRYLADKFFKDHLQTYKKRPIYWLFSSGKQGAFQTLVYLHRYNAGTLSRLRAEYVVPLTGRMQTKIEELEQEVAASSSTAQRNKLTKQLEKLRKQHLELLAYDEQLRHYADQRITLDLDDGVKVNYGKFGDLLAEVKAVTGGKSDDE